MIFLFKMLFEEDGVEELEEYDFDLENEEEEEKNGKRRKIDVKEVPGFMQRFTSTYFKFNPEKIKVAIY